MLSWFDANPGAYWCIVLVAIAAPLYSTLRPFLKRDWQDEKKTDWWWSLHIIALLAAGRWPTWFMTRHYNMDECQLITSARTLRYDPLFWRSVDGMTAGPLDYFALWPAGTLLGNDGYASARLTAMALIAVGLIFAYQTLASLFGRQVARIAVLPAVCVEALTTNFDLLHYSTELVSVCLLSIGFFLFTRRFYGKAGWKWNALAGLILGAVPLAKPQAAPIAALLGFGWIACEFFWPRQPAVFDKTKALVALIISAVIPVCLTAGIIAGYGLWPYVKLAYFEHNMAYVDDGFGVPLYVVLAQLLEVGGNSTALILEWMGGGALWLALTLPLRRTVEWPIQIFVAIALVILVTSLGCVVLPHRPFWHYWQLAVIPWTILMGANLGLIAEGLGRDRPLVRCMVLCSAMFFSVVAVFDSRAGKTAPVEGNLVFFQNKPQGAVASELIKYARPGEAMGMWGWMPNYYVEARLRQATRRNVTNAEMVDSPFIDRFREVYLDDLKHSAPPVFVDATGPENFAFTKRRYSFEYVYPQLADYIKIHYVLASDVGGSRVYVRRDRFAESTGTTESTAK